MTPEAWAVLVGLAMPVLISFLKNCDWPEERKFAVSLAACFIVGGLTAFFSGQLVFTYEAIFVDGAIVFTAAQAVYKLWFGGTRANAWLERNGVS